MQVGDEPIVTPLAIDCNARYTLFMAKRTLTIRVDPVLRDQFEKRAAREEISISVLVQRAMRQLAKRWETPS